jgi:predicted AAA+ superfamily ATPase
MYQRDVYLDQLIRLKGTAPVKVITGVRRCGKSTLLDLFEAHLLQAGVPKQFIIRMNFELDEFEHIKDHQGILAHIKTRFNKKNKGLNNPGRYFILLDEVQAIPGWEKAVNSLRAGKRADLYITGSNAYMLSSELATLLSGRYLEIKMLPLSFREYLEFNHYQKGQDLLEYFTAFMQYGGFPGLEEMKRGVEPPVRGSPLDDKLIRAFLNGIYNTILMKDVVIRSSLRDTDLLEKLVRFMTGNIGNLVSSKKVSDYLTSTGRKTNHETKDTYLELLEKAFFLYRVPRYDIKGKELLKTQGKYYIVDMGLRYWSLGKKAADLGSVLENLVCLELLRRGYQVFVGVLPRQQEIDFVALRNGIITYFQVTATMEAPDVRSRELGALNAVSDNYEKIILSMDKVPFTDYGGIKQYYIPDFLLAE